MMKRPQGITFRFQATDQAGEHRIRRIEDRLGNFLDFKYSPEDRLEQVVRQSRIEVRWLFVRRAGKTFPNRRSYGRAVVYTYDDWGYLDCVAGPALPGEKPVSWERYEYDQVGETRKLVRVFDWKVASSSRMSMIPITFRLLWLRNPAD